MCLFLYFPGEPADWQLAMSKQSADSLSICQKSFRLRSMCVLVLFAICTWVVGVNVLLVMVDNVKCITWQDYQFITARLD